MTDDSRRDRIDFDRMRRTHAAKGSDYDQAFIEANGEQALNAINKDPGLPGDLGEVAKTAAKVARIHESVANLSCLGVWSACVHGRYDVKLPWSRSCSPTSLYCFVVAPSGEGKTTLFNKLMKGVWKWNEQEGSRHKEALSAYERRKKASKDAGLGFDETKPVRDFRLYGSATIEAVTIGLGQGSGVGFWYTDEAGDFMGGYSMKSENRMGSFAGINSAWNGSPVSLCRVTRARIEIPKPRLSIFLGGQLSTARSFFGDSGAEDQGSNARFLVLAAPSLIGSRNRYVETDHDAWILSGFEEKTKAMMGAALPFDENGNLCPIVIDMSEEASEMALSYEDSLEPLRAANELYCDVKSFSLKSPEMACRIAGLLAAWRSPENPLIETQDMEAAIKLARFYLNEAKRFMGIATQSRATSDAEEMLKEIVRLSEGQGFVTDRQLRKSIKSPFRSQRERADKALSDLERAGDIYVTKGEKGGKRYMISD